MHFRGMMKAWAETHGGWEFWRIEADFSTGCIFQNGAASVAGVIGQAGKRMPGR